MREKNSKNSKNSNMSRGCREPMKSWPLTKKTKTNKQTNKPDSEPPCGPSKDISKGEIRLVWIELYRE